MSFWPRCQLSDYEKKYLTKYPSPDNNVRGVLRRFMPGRLNLTQFLPNPAFQFQVARRTKIFGVTFAGDIEQFAIKFQTAVGEQLFTDFMEVSLLTGGSNTGLPGLIEGIVSQPATPQTPNTGVMIPSVNPFILNPAFELSPNEVLTVYGKAVVQRGWPFGEDYPLRDYSLSMTIHYWEYPGMPGSPR